MIGCLVAIITGIGKQQKTAFKQRKITTTDRLVYTINSRENHRQVFNFWPVGIEIADIVKSLLYFFDLKIRQLPVAVRSRKPKFSMVYLDAAHEFAETGFVRLVEFYLEAVDLVL